MKLEALGVSKEAKDTVMGGLNESNVLTQIKSCHFKNNAETFYLASEITSSCQGS